MPRICIDLDLKNPLAEQAVRNRLQSITGINETIKKKLARQIELGVQKGETVPEIAKRLKLQFEMADYRARLIARTEANAAASDAKKIQFDDMFGTGYDKEWISSRDPFVRESHNDVDSEVVKSTEHFSNGLTRPHDPDGPPEEVCNCRCTWVAHPVGE